jgi:hypothetical protein
VFGDFAGALDNGGELVALSDASAAVQDSVQYGTDPPWDFLADGFGASLERLCATSSGNDPVNWRASPVPATPEEFGGSPGAPSAASLCPPVAPARPRIFISEIMYHPVLEQSLEDDHEFIELHNADAAPVSTAGWRLVGAVDYTFPAGSSIPGSGYVVIAKNRAALATVAAYGLSLPSIYGDYARQLDNGGEKVGVISSGGQGVDSVAYDDDFPWPSGADALGRRRRVPARRVAAAHGPPVSRRVSRESELRRAVQRRGELGAVAARRPDAGQAQRVSTSFSAPDRGIAERAAGCRHWTAHPRRRTRCVSRLGSPRRARRVSWTSSTSSTTSP